MIRAERYISKHEIEFFLPADEADLARMKPAPSHKFAVVVRDGDELVSDETFETFNEAMVLCCRLCDELEEKGEGQDVAVSIFVLETTRITTFYPKTAVEVVEPEGDSEAPAEEQATTAE